MAYLWLLTTSRKQIMKDAGLYKGAVDSKKDESYLDGVEATNKKYLPKKFHKRVYFKETDIVLRNLRNFHESGVKNFKLEEFKCGCGRRHCSGYPAVLSKYLLSDLQLMRNNIGAMTISSGLRCQKYNDSLTGSAKNSEHLHGRAVDFYGKGTDEYSKRKDVKRKWLTLPYANYTYSDTPNMGEAVHVQVKK